MSPLFFEVRLSEGGVCTQVFPVDPDTMSIADNERVMLFVHGVDYGSVEEVVKDLVQPFMRCAQSKEKFLHQSHRCIVFVWNSKLASLSKIDSALDGHQGSAAAALIDPLKFLRSWPLWKREIECVENRAMKNVAHIEGFLQCLHRSSISSSKVHIISHSMGSLIVAHALTKVFSSDASSHLPKWWSFQPCMSRWEIEQCSSMRSLFDRYGTLLGGQQLRIWHSRFDIVLGLVYLLGRRKISVGLRGIRNLRNCCVDVTLSALEAHGSLALFGKRKSFFERIAHTL